MPRRIPVRSLLYCEKGERKIRRNHALGENSAVFGNQEPLESLKDRFVKTRNRAIQHAGLKLIVCGTVSGRTTGMPETDLSMD